MPLRRFRQQAAKMAAVDASALRIGGNLYRPPRRAPRAGHLRGAMGGFHPAVETSHFTITPGLLLSQGVNEPVDIGARVTAFSVRNSINDAMASIRITLAMGLGATSLSPFVDVSVYRDVDGRPLLDPGSRFFLNVTIDDPAAPGSGGPVTLISGRVDRVNAKAGPGLIELQCRDEGAFYQNVTVEAGKYGDSAGREASLVMGDLLTAHGFSPTELLVLADPDWMVLEYEQAEVGLLDALRNIARQAGRDVRYFASVGKLVYYTPDRVGTTSDLIVNPGRYEDIVALEVGDEDVRNYWDVFYQDIDGVRHGPRTVQDAASIARYGNGKPRRARINLGLADNIRDDAAADTFAAAALADTKDPFVSHSVRALFLPQTELNDLHYYSANNVEYDNNLQVAVAEYLHEYANGHAMSTVSGRATRAAAYRAYRKYPPPRVIVSLFPPDDAVWAPPGTIHMQTDSLAFPA